MSKLAAMVVSGLLISSLGGTSSFAAAPAADFYNQGLTLYNAGRFSEATDAFEIAVKKHDRADESQAFIDRIRKETVERIRNKALTGVSKTNWQTKYYYMNSVDNRIRVGISSEELFERDSLNFRPGALDAMAQLATIIARADASRIDVELINEVNQDTAAHPELTSQQLTAIFSYLSLASRGLLPKYQ
jgi:flagellar motor protein MotB